MFFGEKIQRCQRAAEWKKKYFQKLWFLGFDDIILQSLLVFIVIIFYYTSYFAFVVQKSFVLLPTWILNIYANKNHFYLEISYEDTYLNLWNGKGFIMSIILLRTVQIILSHLGNIDKCKAKKEGKLLILLILFP